MFNSVTNWLLPNPFLLTAEQLFRMGIPKFVTLVTLEFRHHVVFRLGLSRLDLGLLEPDEFSIRYLWGWDVPTGGIQPFQ